MTGNRQETFSLLFWGCLVNLIQQPDRQRQIRTQEGQNEGKQQQLPADDTRCLPGDVGYSTVNSFGGREALTAPSYFLLPKSRSVISHTTMQNYLLIRGKKFVVLGLILILKSNFDSTQDLLTICYCASYSHCKKPSFTADANGTHIKGSFMAEFTNPFSASGLWCAAVAAPATPSE